MKLNPISSILTMFCAFYAGDKPSDKVMYKVKSDEYLPAFYYMCCDHINEGHDGVINVSSRFNIIISKDGTSLPIEVDKIRITVRKEGTLRPFDVVILYENVRIGLLKFSC